MTNKEFFTIVANGKGTISYKNENGNTEYTDATVTDSVVVEFAKSQLEKLSAKNDSRNEKARAKKSAENEPIIKAIRDVLADGKTHFAADVCVAVGQNSPKVAALVGKMEDVTVGKAKKEGAKAKTTTYTLTIAE